ncbi:hypothetical protein AN8970.2 [Aspergillus nidulans FGSC A4]|uniref:Oxidoreductase CipA-like, putative (AFU_orthologue AFUA_1G12460) n=1 Tax=Emericella nidulans (strain FGSC A4 / ATCC 38163 / CBS 112.46 / NRRL 194 / M139) TaxID=227321 RepID=Q5ARW0_EMENI|nr:hypothetical protein [Aspergillus nidulans FGSC A4]EAA63765.1 hypothetical protein AN8970.2 [Aspergillus nidulans FGSC A4]CBF84544.1 TPA: oxidoreductase CipA-like, putative (AFU_orthologue; AFUA_1G12460) [Aspergillus nidulans FGSC A4]|eukprot:XP_682239.1 hypothetical protein AN8970.2 [Aspergillus nidulans FGSC A4]
MTIFRRVALIGRGSLGTVLLDELLNSNFTVTVLTRSASSASSLPPGADIKQVDYSSAESLKTALAGHDIVISTLSPSAIPLQKQVIDAAIAVGVKRFIPAEYGAMTSDPVGRKLPFHKDAIEIHEFLRETVASGLIEYTVFGVGVLTELLFTTTLVVDLEHREVKLFDGGIHSFSTSRLETVARAVVASLHKPDETRNRVIRVHDAVLTQRQVLDMAKGWTPTLEWREVYVDAQAEVDRGLKQLEKEFSPALVPGVFAAALMSGRYGAEYKEVDNELLGLGFMDKREINDFGKKFTK